MQITQLWHRMQLQRHWQITLAGVWGMGLVLIACIVLDPVFQTNDDVTMAMRVHGFGQFTVPTPYIVYSNILWGYILYALPPIAGYLAYAWVYVVLMIFYSWSITYYLLRTTLPTLIALCMSALILIQPLVILQFTSLAGFLSLVSMLALWQYTRTPSGWLLLVLLCSGVAALMIRTIMFPLIGFIALPLFWQQWRLLRTDRKLLFALVGLLGFAVFAMLLNGWAYQQTPEMARFHNLYRTYQPFFNNGATSVFHANPELLAASPYTAQDVTLIALRFLVPGILTDLDALRLLIANFRLWPPQTETIVPVIRTSFSSLFNGYTSLIVITTTLLYIQTRTVRQWMFVVLFACAVLMICLSGRVVHGRVLYPLFSAVFVFSVLLIQQHGRAKKSNSRLMMLGLIGLLVVQFQDVQRTSVSFAFSRRQLTKDMAQIPDKPYLVWGATPLAYNALYPLAALRTDQTPLTHYTLALSAIQPRSVFYEAVQNGYDLNAALRSDEGVYAIMNPNFAGALTPYCKKHLNATFTREVIWKRKVLTLQRIRCVVNTVP
jgi:hypothetical protein